MGEPAGELGAVELAQQVGGSFVQQYYTTLLEEPEQLGRFYDAESTLCFNQSSLLKGEEQIKDAYAKLGIESIELNHCLLVPSREHDVLVVAAGTFRCKDGAERQVSQTVLLGQQDGARYRVVNDVLTVAQGPVFLSSAGADAGAQEAEPAAAAPVEESAKPVAAEPTPEQEDVEEEKDAASGEPTATKSAAVPAERAEKPKAAEAPASPAATKPQKQKQQQQQQKSTAPATANNNNNNAQAEAKQAAKPVQVNKAPLSFAEIAKQKAKAPAPAPPAAPVAPATTTAKPAPQANGTASAAKPAQRGKKPEAPKAGTSLFVKDIRKEWGQEVLREIFGGFGTIRSVELPSGKAFAFVNFESTEGASAALEARPIAHDGKTLSVELRMPQERLRSMRPKGPRDPAARDRGDRGGRGGSFKGAPGAGPAGRGRGRGSGGPRQGGKPAAAPAPAK